MVSRENGTPRARGDVRLTRVTLAEQTAEMLKNRIVWGELAPEARLIEADLAEELGISRTPIRQALQRLEADGLVVRQSWGLVVSPFDLDVAVETLLMRELLEPFAAEHSTPHLEPPEIVRLNSIVREMQEQTEGGAENRTYGAELNIQFHNLLNSRCPYRRIIETIQVARDASSALRLYSTYTVEDLERVHEEHVAIVDAATAAAEGAGSPRRVAKLVREHMRNARDALLRNIAADPARRGAPPRDT